MNRSLRRLADVLARDDIADCAAERRCLARSAVIDALQARLSVRLQAAKAQRRRAEGRTGIPACPKRERRKPA